MKSRKRAVEPGAVAVCVLQLFIKKASAKSKEPGAEVFVEGGLVQSSGCEVHQRQRNSLVRQLLTNAKKRFRALVA